MLRSRRLAGEVLSLRLPSATRQILALGAHCDDIEIGAGGALSVWAQANPHISFTFVILTSTQERASESRGSLAELVSPMSSEVIVHELPDTRLPAHFQNVKDILSGLARREWDIVLTHHRFDAHQDHRMLGELVPTAFRNHLVMQFEIPKWDGDLGASRPNVYVPLTKAQVDRKWHILNEHYASQRGKDWWEPETFSSLARLRGLECRAPYAEAFRVEKMVLAPLTRDAETQSSPSRGAPTEGSD